MCKEKAEEETQPSETKVSVQLFDSPAMNFTVPGDIPWTDPKFSEVVAQEALDRYKETSVWVTNQFKGRIKKKKVSNPFGSELDDKINTWQPAGG